MRMIILAVLTICVAQNVSAGPIEIPCLAPPIIEKGILQTGGRIGDDAQVIHGSPFSYSIPSEGKIRLTHTEMGYTTEFWSPTGDWPMVIIGYDPENQILYGDSYFDAAWIKLEISVNTVIVIDKGVVRPSLYRRSNSLKSDSHGPLRYSAALHSLFYSGYALSWWQRSGLQSWIIRDGEVSRIHNFGDEVLVYVADDSATNLAVLKSENGELLSFDGERVVGRYCD